MVVSEMIIFFSLPFISANTSLSVVTHTV